MQTEHPFAQYVRILGKGKNGSRALTQEEALASFRMVMNDEVLPEQLGAYLMLLRVKEEEPEELAGFIRAVRETIERWIWTGRPTPASAVSCPGSSSAPCCWHRTA